MARITRRRFAKSVAAVTAGSVFSINTWTSRARAAEFVFKYANQQPVTNPINIRAREAIKKISQETNGRVEIQIFPNNQLGSDTDMISQLRTGAIDFMTETGALMENLVPTASVNGVGFAFPNYAAVWKAMDGDLGAHVRAAFAKARLHCFEKMWDNGFRQTTSSIKPINTPADFKGFKIRVPVSPIQVSLFKGLGASPTSLPIKEVYSALQTRLADGQENALVLIEVFKFYEVQKYCSMTSHMWDGFWMLASGKSWSRLPKDLQEIISRNWNEAALKQRADSEQLAKSLQATLETKGMIFNHPNIEPFRATLQASGFYKEWREKFGDEVWQLLEKYTGKLA
jgi:tripartite ATP-independent transporter DctP family solute receptor